MQRFLLVKTSCLAEKILFETYRKGPKIISADMFNTSSAAISITKHFQVSECKVPIEIKIIHVEKLKKQKLVHLKYVRTENQPSDISKKKTFYHAFKIIFPLFDMGVENRFSRFQLVQN